MSNKPLTKRQQFWLEHLKACEQQGYTMVEYAREHALHLRGLYDAKKALVNKGFLPRQTKSHFQKVKIATKPARLTHCTLSLPNGVNIEWPTDGSLQSLSQILTVAVQVK